MPEDTGNSPMQPSKPFLQLLKLIAINLFIVLLLTRFFPGLSSKIYVYGSGASLGVILLLSVAFLRRLGIRLPLNFYYRFLAVTEDTTFDTLLIWNNPWLRSTILWGILNIIWTSSFWWIAAGAVIVRLCFIFAPKQKEKTLAFSGPHSFSFQTEKSILRIDNLFRGMLIIGGAGSGKSKSLVEPLIHQAADKGWSSVVYDYKFPVLAEEVNGSYTDPEVQKCFINFMDLSKTHRINPFSPEIVENASYAREFASTIIMNLDPEATRKRDFWVQSAEAILTGTIFFLKEEYPNMCTLPHAVSLLLTDKRTQLLHTLQQNIQVAGIISSALSALKSENTINSMFATIQNQLSILNTPEIFWVMSGNDFSLAINDPDAKKVLVLGNSPSLSNTFSPLLSLILMAALKQMNKPGKSPSIVIMDEFPTLILPRFDELPATARSNQIATVVIAQDLAQLEDRYGQSKTETIVSNLGNQAYGRTTNPKTAERVSRLFGKEDREYKTNSISYNDDATSISQSKSLQQRERLEAADVMRFQTGTFAGLVAEGSRTEFRTYFKSEKSRAIPLDEINQVTAAEVHTNFLRIKEDVLNILGGPPIKTEDESAIFQY